MRALCGLALTLCIGEEARMSNTLPPEISIYKILTLDQWTAFCRDGTTQGSPLDHADGYIHFSTAAQVAGTLGKHFKGAGPLILAETPLSELGGQDVRWETARNGDLFPHLYGVLRRDSVSRHWPLHPDAHGGYDLPERLGT